jgi:glycine dehydrogenase
MEPNHSFVAEGADSRPEGASGRQIGPSASQILSMLEVVGYESLEELAEAALGTRAEVALRLPLPMDEAELRRELQDIGARNRPAVSMIGLGFYGTHMPAVIRRNVLESPAWYSAYTPYQAEISQGRLEALLNFQTMVAELTALASPNASLLDEASAAAEAMILARRAGGGEGGFLVDRECFPQTKAVLATRADPLGIELVETDLAIGVPEGRFFGALIQYPGASGRIWDPSAAIREIKDRGGLVAMAADLLALCLIRPPGELGADIAVGSTQRFGVPMYGGGPHAAYMAVRSELTRLLPGRIVGVSRDRRSKPALRLALQAREQHIRRERATSNICTAQVLPAILASFYAVYHGPDGLRKIAEAVHSKAAALAGALREAGVRLAHEHFFDTLTLEVPEGAQRILERAEALGINLRMVDRDHIALSCDETTTNKELLLVAEVFGAKPEALKAKEGSIPKQLERRSPYLTQAVFNRYHSELSLLRYIRRLGDRDLAMDRSPIPLGSCTMKLNPAGALECLSDPRFGDLHPFAPKDQLKGYERLAEELESYLAELTGYDAVSLHPNSGAQGELAGLLAIRGYLASKGESERRICLLPASAHGTNAASAALAGMEVVGVRSDETGQVDLDDLRRLLGSLGDKVACLMLTYPSTYGVFDGAVREATEAAHSAGAQVFLDGANLNALMGLVRLADLGADVSQLNLHKTFAVPHGGGGPGAGPVALRSHLTRWLPGRSSRPGRGQLTSSKWGSAALIPISWWYIRMLGSEGLRQSAKIALLAANYVAARLDGPYRILRSPTTGLVAHECVVDLRELTRRSGITAEDVAKRLMDWGLHAPTMSFPLAGTLMVEPTESEDLEPIEWFCEAMLAIRKEIEAVAKGTWPKEDNPLKNAPHTQEDLLGEWTHPYPKSLACFPAGYNPDKYWPPVARVDNAYGDRNLVLTCQPLSEERTRK